MDFGLISALVSLIGSLLEGQGPTQNSALPPPRPKLDGGPQLQD